LKTSFGTKRVRANEVYQEYIKDKGHVHMNSTVWHTLTGFVMYLGKSGKCKIDQNEKGWYIQYIDQEEVIRRAEEAKRAKAEKDDEERQQEMINAQVRRALELQGGEVAEPQATELMRTDENEKITLNLNLDKKPTLEELRKPVFSGVSVFDQVKTKKEDSRSDEEERPSSRRRDRSRDREERRDRRDRETKKERRSRSRSHDRDKGRRAESPRGGRPLPSTSKRDAKPKKSALDEIREQQECSSEVVIDELFLPGVLVKLDQAHVETVIPKVGREMKIVNGAYRGCVAKLESLDQDAFCLNLRITEGPMNGRTVRVPYEDASKLA
uniref:Kin17_mid domain-containing protein n=1 Tax=Heligmosomoides polygyrus TaxID=6339 RepID=A0A183GVA1_HELPZ